MTLIKLNEIDKIKIKADVGLSLVIGLLFCVFLIFLLFLLPSAAFFFGFGVKKGFFDRSLFVLVLLILPFLVISCANILKCVDLVRGKKIRFNTQTFNVELKKKSLLIYTKENRKFEIFDDILPLLNTGRSITIEFLPLSKKVLFISHDDQNYLE